MKPNLAPAKEAGRAQNKCLRPPFQRRIECNKRTQLPSDLHRMLELADLVMAFEDRLISPVDNGPALGGQVIRFQGSAELALEIVLAAFDLVDDRLVVAARDGCLQVEEALVGLAGERTIIGRITAQTADFRAQIFG